MDVDNDPIIYDFTRKRKQKFFTNSKSKEIKKELAELLNDLK